MLEEGAVRCSGFQDRGYARLYLDRLEPIVNLDHAADGYKLTNETGRFLALWMCYEDVIRVADLKTRRSRFERVREEVRAKPHEPVHIVEFLSRAWTSSPQCSRAFSPARSNAWRGERSRQQAQRRHAR